MSEDEKKDAAPKTEAPKDALWKEMSCSFCGRKPFEVEQMIERRGARICNFCVAEFRSQLKG